MKIKSFVIVVLSLFAAIIFIQINSASAQELHYPPLENKWNADSLGNHRAVIAVTETGDVAKAKVMWRRKDHHPHSLIYLVDSATNEIVKNVYFPVLNRAYCIIVFEHKDNHKTYYLYYMPYRHKGSQYYPKDYYPEFEKTANADWLASAKQESNFAAAHLVKLEAVDPFNSFYPMELIATQEETETLIAQHSNKQYLVFPENRMHPIKMKKDLPYRWIKRGVDNQFTGVAKKGAYYAFQLGLYPIKKGLKNVKVAFSSLKSNTGQVISDSLITCINTNGISFTGEPVIFTVNVPKKNIRALWCYIKVPEEIAAGLYKGTATIDADNAPTTTINLNLRVTGETAIHHGVNKPWKMTRLPWLNSTIAQKNTVIAPYVPLQVHKNTVSLLGRKLTIAPSGLPKQIQTYFPIEMTSISTTANNLLKDIVHFNVLKKEGKKINFKSSGIQFTKQKPGTVEWKAMNTSDNIKMAVKGHIEFDGHVAYQVKVIALQDIQLQDIQLNIPFRPEVTKYFMGLGLKGGLRPDKIDWKWDVKHKNQDGGWIGAVNAGVRFSLRDQHYVRPLNTNFYLLKPLILPTSWGNNNKGGIHISKIKNKVLLNAYSGRRSMQKGDTLYYNFNLLITPFHPLYTQKHFQRRYYHAYNPVDTAKTWGATVINIHQGNFINPYINYPFVATNQMKNYIDSAHHLGIKVKIYNTVRELSNRAYELYPLISLGTEVFPSGDGGGYPWLQEHLDGDYIAGWYTPNTNDAAIVTNGMNRWLNYYVSGMNWLVNNVGIDGLYLDDVAFDRNTIKRVKRMLLQNGHPAIIDLHSANQYNKSDGFNNSANLYLPLFPYINRLWFGEYFDYDNNSPGFFMTEVSGIPYGLMGEMLQDGGNPWRGMLYGMTSRAPWTDRDPRPIWEVWNQFGIEESEMIGYWVPDCPVTTNNPNVLATVYKKENKILVSIASWAKADTKIHLNINWKALGINSKNAAITAPEIKGFQSAAAFEAGDAIPVQPKKGWLLIIE